MYKQLTREKRYILNALKQEGCKQSRIAEHLKVAPSTVSRELRRNRSKRGYRPAAAHRLAMGRKRLPRKPEKLTPEVKHLRCFLEEFQVAMPTDENISFRHHIQENIPVVFGRHTDLNGQPFEWSC